MWTDFDVYHIYRVYEGKFLLGYKNKETVQTMGSNPKFDDMFQLVVTQKQKQFPAKKTDLQATKKDSFSSPTPLTALASCLKCDEFLNYS